MPTKDTPTDRVLKELLAGRHDDRLLEVVEGCLTRAVTVGVTTYWRCSLDGIEFSEDDLTIAMYESVKRRTGYDWHELALARIMAEVDVCRAVVESVLIHRDGMTADEASARVGAIPARLVLTAFTNHQVDPPSGGA